MYLWKLPITCYLYGHNVYLTPEEQSEGEQEIVKQGKHIRNM